jgi:hypothetical protein
MQVSPTSCTYSLLGPNILSKEQGNIYMYKPVPDYTVSHPWEAPIQRGYDPVGRYSQRTFISLYRSKGHKAASRRLRAV